jgi:tetraacyldisaccharide 4'-kinase
MLPLLPAEAIYRALYRKRRARFSRDPIDVGVPVVSVGNLTVGGTGKTPCVQWVAQQFQGQKRRVAVVARGYGGALSQSGALVSDGEKIFHTAREVGDEPLLHARHLPGVIVVIGADRVAAARRAIDECGAEIIILDDGFQYWSLKRDCDLVLLDARAPFGNGRLLPAGRLREPPDELKRADVIILTRCKRATAQELEATREEIKRYSQALVLWSDHVPCGVRDEATGEVFPLDILKNTPVAALAALANNEQFFGSAQDAGASVIAKLARRDHHHWREDEVRRFAQSSSNAKALLTTEKDAVKMQAAWSNLPLWSLQIALFLGDGEAALHEYISRSVGVL